MVNSKFTVEKDALDLYYYNATSIRGKLLDFNSHFHDDYDCISVSESWLNEFVIDSEILINGSYNIFRRDRNLDTSSKRDGGGVMVAVKSLYNSKRRLDLETNIEIIWVQIELSDNVSAFVGTVYIPYPDQRFTELLETSLNMVTNQCKLTDPIAF